MSGTRNDAQLDETQLHAEFDGLSEAVLRQRTSEKWAHYPSDILPAWVAEMDFPLAEPVTEVLERSIQLGDLGYPRGAESYGVPQAFAQRMRDRFDWDIDPAAVELTSDVMQGVYVAILALTNERDGVLVQTPIYPPFFSAVHETKRSLVTSQLRAGDAGYGIDWDDLEQRAASVKLLLLSNPHNPTGRVFTEQELTKLGDLALGHDWWIVSDEIHADLVYPGHRHIPIASLNPALAARTITLSSASKAFNLPGLKCAVAHFGSAELRRRFSDLVPSHVRGGVGLLGQLATLAAWREGDPWLSAVMSYLESNRNWLERQWAERFPKLRCLSPQATYLAWLDCRDLELPTLPAAFFREHARVALSDGHFFGRAFKGFARLNFATSRALLGEILDRMQASLAQR